jgi:hypothetical protein
VDEGTALIIRVRFTESVVEVIQTVLGSAEGALKGTPFTNFKSVEALKKLNFKFKIVTYF